MADFTFVDLFAGIGGFRQALSSVGGTCVGFSEIYKDAINAYCDNYNEDEKANLGDITKIKSLPRHDFMTAGVPCQSWSIAGKKLGFDDDRGQLWNDTLFLLNQARPKAFIFENVKGLADPRNANALEYILGRIAEAGYHARKYILNSYDYGVPQTRVRIYIIGFREKLYFDRFNLPRPVRNKTRLCDVLDDVVSRENRTSTMKSRWSLSCNEKGFNTYFLFNDLRNGDTTIHSWDIQETTERQKGICRLLLRNRRKKDYGPLDGNPLSLQHLQTLDKSITQGDLDSLVNLGILKKVSYLYRVTNDRIGLTDGERTVLNCHRNGLLNVDELKVDRQFKIKKVSVTDTLRSLEEKGVIACCEERYDFKNTKISTGLNGVNRIFLPSSDIYPTLVASDTNDFVTSVDIDADSVEDFRARFMREVYLQENYRKITKSEACRIQGFPADFRLPESRARWMHLIGNSVSVPVVRHLALAVIRTGVFGDFPDDVKTSINELDSNMAAEAEEPVQLELFGDECHKIHDC